MAPDRKSEPPRSVEEWQVWADACIQTNRRDWCDIPWIRWTEDEPWNGPGPIWTPLAEDHPFKGKGFCWRCTAEASGISASGVPHNRQANTVRWCPAEGDEAPGHADQDGVQAREVRIADPSRPALSGAEDFRQWWQVGASIVRDESQDFADTGTFFYEASRRPMAEVPGGGSALRAVSVEEPEPVRPHPLAPWWDLTEDGRVLAKDFRTDPTNYPAGWCAPANYAPAVEPVQADQPERTAQHGAEPVEADEADGEDRQPGTDEEA